MAKKDRARVLAPETAERSRGCVARMPERAGFWRGETRVVSPILLKTHPPSDSAWLGSSWPNQIQYSWEW